MSYTKGDIASWMIDQVRGGYNINVRDSSVIPCLCKRIARVGGEISTTSLKEQSIPENEWESNALLIAAAPDLLEACEKIRDKCLKIMTAKSWLEELFPIYDIVKAAIAKAKEGK